MTIQHTIEIYRRVDGDGFLARFWTAGEKSSMIVTGASEEEVRQKVADHYERAEAEIRRQTGLTEARLEKARLERERRKAKEAEDG
jgi:hypothetical protein